jgi:hypothetical protein
MNLCPANRVNSFQNFFNCNHSPYHSSPYAVYKDFVQSYRTTEPAIDLTSTFLMWSWKLAGHPAANVP